ncbi:sensor histidine kinase [Brachybacterium paraconglomeratum]|uniref:sensor histidine kinase n=1 Tax=Brachybacterium paraconglomeratum TaxID=173362 RepID=UPI0022B05A4E|nr:HAMP domain-containing sensor histidine kinase [Brachybacterium paraconglomeratum]MCZ4327778.1 HAMP domain-containing sensor histidine kinase [Brachybacterium paraconglomeratum]
MAMRDSVRGFMSEVVDGRGGQASKQLYFVLFFLGITLIVAASGIEQVLTGAYLWAIAILVVATALAYGLPWKRLAPGWDALVPVMDIAAIAILRQLMGGVTPAVSMLAFIPVIWLAGRLKVTGTVIATAAALLMISVPGLMQVPQLTALAILQALMWPVMALQVGLLISGALTLIEAQAASSRASPREKEVLLRHAASQEQLLQNVIDSLSAGIVVVDRYGHDLLMNRAQQHIHQVFSPPENEDPNESQLVMFYPGTAIPIPAEDRPVRRAVLKETFSNCTVAAGPTGTGAPTFSASARQILDVDGERDGAVVVFSDVTPFFEMSRAQRKFVADVSHELRTPLTSVIGYLDLVMDDPELPERSRKHLEIAERNAEQLLTLVSDLLQDHISQEQGAMKLDLQSARLSELAAQAVESIAPRAASGGVGIEVDLAQTPRTDLDPARITLALGNLLSNAVKYTPRGGTVTVRTSTSDGAVQASVSDTGIGMSDKEVAHLFTDYFRTPTALQHNIAGHGIGLTLARRALVAHGGQISVRSEPGKGSEFTLRLPLDVHEQPPGRVE